MLSDGLLIIGFTTFFDSELTKIIPNLSEMWVIPCVFMRKNEKKGHHFPALAALLKFPPLESAVVQICLEFHLLTHLAQQVIKGFCRS